MARREIESGFPEDTFSAEFRHFQLEMEAPSVPTVEMGLYVTAMGALLGMMSLVMNPGDLTNEVQKKSIEVGGAGIGLIVGGIAVLEGVIPGLLASIRMAAVESGVIEGYDPVARGCIPCLEDKQR